MPKNVNALIIALQAAENGDAPEWLHLLPATSFKGVDGRGPYATPDLQKLIATFNRDGKKLPVDENHAIDLAGKAGLPSPARGWIVELQAREDGLWGRVEWTNAGRSIVSGKDYGYLSPVFTHSAAKPYKIERVLRVALTNDPNLDFLTALHSTQETDMLEELRKALGLSETATEADVLAAVAAAHAANQTNAALMAGVREAAGVAVTADETTLITTLQSRGKATPAEAEVADLKGQIVSLQTQLTTLATTGAREKAETAIQSAIEAGKIVPVMKDHMIARHMKNPAEVEAEIKLMPSLNAGGLGHRPPSPPGNGNTAVRSAEDDAVLAQMGLDPTAFDAEKKALHTKGLI